ncbi:hypothetical protein GCM10027084_28390 [Pseudoxanthomonas sangjuensis]|uniref:nuclear transport factor 2 family protein n=1 Tax=Pseudoxanthomonas sangjuensis TaxID=1503750 RepID=UPI001391AF9C|nr:nuclear transport factor 2 family protein [Pseudoxanthomonas sangjuensis]KAF1713694.1 polyketide cyclase [Pseudoxanthomonas sangjuensis]
MSNKDAALDFLQMVVAGDIDAAYERHVAPDLVHHNAYVPAGADALRAAMKEAHARQPGKVFEVRQAIAGDDRVAVHSHLRFKPEDRGYAVVHLFRFEAGRIAEMWDMAQEVPADSPNADGLF